MIVIGAEDGYLPVGSEGSTEPSCTNSSVQVVVNDDFDQPVTTDYYLVDLARGETITSFWFGAASGRPAGERLFSPTGKRYRGYCDGAVSLVPEGGPAVSIPGLVQRVVNQLDPPDPLLEVTPHHGKHAVQMLSWLAVDPAYWSETRTASAAAGRVLVTATLTPIETVWDMGNGETETCDNPGTVWRSGMDDSRSRCGYTYRQPSLNPPNNTYDLSGTVRFEVSHTTNAPGTYGPFTPVERTTSETIEVVEIQAVGR